MSAGRICRVNLATCPNATTATEIDSCAAKTDTVINSTTTYHNCSCVEGGWPYEYPVRSNTQALTNITVSRHGAQAFTGCANPDGDPMGPWCAVDPETCEVFAGEVKVGSKVSPEQFLFVWTTCMALANILCSCWMSQSCACASLVLCRHVRL